MLGAAAPVAASAPASGVNSISCYVGYLHAPWLSLSLWLGDRACMSNILSVLLRTSGRDAVTQDPDVCRVAQTTDHHLTYCLRLYNVAKANYNLILESLASLPGSLMPPIQQLIRRQARGKHR